MAICEDIAFTCKPKTVMCVSLTKIMSRARKDIIYFVMCLSYVSSLLSNEMNDVLLVNT